MKIFKKLLIRRFQKLGYSSYFAPRVLEQSYQDLFHNPNTTLKEKLWAQRRGFLSDKIAFYGLNEENYRDYLSDFDYWRMHPINGEFSHWIDDKLTIRYLLQSFQPYLPQYFYHLGRSEVLRLVDCPDKLGQSIDSILLLLRDQKHLAVKLLSGSAGEGFYKLQFIMRLSISTINWFLRKN